jgi:hypothetical protein
VRMLRRNQPNAGANRGPSKAGWLGHYLHERLPCTPETMRRSLESSLRAMGTDRVEFLLIHEPAEFSRLTDLAACAAALKQSGKIRGWGVAASHALLPPVGLAAFDLLQVDVPSASPDYARVRDLGQIRPLVLFSALRGCPEAKVLARLRGLWADLPRAVILCSMFNPDHIRANAAAAA